MKSLQGTHFYLSCLFFYKVAIGAILLITSWDSMGVTNSNNSITNVVIVMGLSFFPAMFARPIVRVFTNISAQVLLLSTLALGSIFILIECFLIHQNSSLFFIIHFFVWVLIFVAEVATEKWFVSLSHGFELGYSRRLSGISVGIGQVGIVTGPIIAMLTNINSDILPYWTIFCCFAIASLLALLGKQHLNKFQEDTEDIYNKSFNKMIPIVTQHQRLLYILGFAIIWPTLTIFNISTPVLAKFQFNTIEVAAIMEALISLAMAFAGFFHPLLIKLKSSLFRAYIVAGLLVLSSISMYLLDYSAIAVLVGTFLLGASFGYLRVELRAYLAKHYESNKAGHILAIANSWSGPLVIIYSLMFYLNSKMVAVKGLTISFPITFIICASLFLVILTREAWLETFNKGHLTYSC